MSVECDALIDAGVAYATREACCAKMFGPAGCGTGCFVPKERGARGQGGGDGPGPSYAGSSSSSGSSGNPNRECALLPGPARCVARRRARLPVFAAEPECCAAVYGGPCMRFPDRCYAVDPDWPGQCRAVNGAAECAALYWAAREKALASGIVIGNGAGLAGNGGGGGASEDEDGTGDVGFSLTREACCRANDFERAICAQTVECYEPDYRALPTRRCAVTESPGCLERMAAGGAYSTRGGCCASAFGAGRGCREFPSACYRLDLREFAADGSPLRPFDACPRVEGASVGTCALLLERDGAAAQEAAEAEAAAVAAAAAAARRRRYNQEGGGAASASVSPRPGAGGEATSSALAPRAPTPRVFEQRVDCCSAAVPLGWVDFGSPDLARGCPYAPSSCWAPVRAQARPGPGGGHGTGTDIFCVPIVDRPADCARRVSGGTAWVARDECCRRVGGCASARRAGGGGAGGGGAGGGGAGGGGSGGKARTTRVTRGPASPRAPGTTAISLEAALATNAWGAGAGAAGMDAIEGIGLEAAAPGGGGGGGAAGSGGGGGGGRGSGDSGGGDGNGLAPRRRADTEGLGELGGGGISQQPPGLAGPAAARDQATRGGAAARTAATGAGGAAAGVSATATAAAPARPAAVAAAPPRRPRTAREIATEPSLDAGRDRDQERPAPAPARAAAAAAPAPAAMATRGPSPPERYRSEQTRAILPDPSSYWDFGTEEAQPQQPRQPGPLQERAPADRRGRLQQEQRTWPATPVEVAPAPPAPPLGPHAVAATPSAAPSYFASGKRRRRRSA